MLDGMMPLGSNEPYKPNGLIAEISGPNSGADKDVIIVWWIVDRPAGHRPIDFAFVRSEYAAEFALAKARELAAKGERTPLIGGFSADRVFYDISGAANDMLDVVLRANRESGGIATAKSH